MCRFLLLIFMKLGLLFWNCREEDQDGEKEITKINEKRKKINEKRLRRKLSLAGESFLSNQDQPHAFFKMGSRHQAT